VSAAQLTYGSYGSYGSRPRPALGRAATLSALVHICLLVVLFLGVRFQSNPPDTVTVELWETPPPPPPVVEEKPPPKPVPQPEPEPQVKKPEIALPEKPKPKPKPEPKRDLAFEKKLREQAALEEKKIDEQRKERELRELIARQQAAARNKAIAAWQDKIVTKVRGNIIFDIRTVPPNIEAIFDVTLLPSGEVLDAIKRKSSGNAAYDDAVYRAILKSSPLPKPDDPSVFERRLTLKFHPGDR
jgi:colicin import membrane protein